MPGCLLLRQLLHWHCHGRRSVHHAIVKHHLRLLLLLLLLLLRRRRSYQCASVIVVHSVLLLLRWHLWRHHVHLLWRTAHHRGTAVPPLTPILRLVLLHVVWRLRGVLWVAIGVLGATL
jgi:hypothetical protein